MLHCGDGFNGVGVMDEKLYEEVVELGIVNDSVI